MKNILVITGGAGFIGSNLIELLLKKTKYNIISIDNYSSGLKNNHILNNRVNYLKGDTIDFFKHFNKIKKKIKTIFHFAEFSRIFQSFKKISECLDSNIHGTAELFKFALLNKIKLVYSATSASLGNNGKDMNLSPYSFTKAKNLELLENLKKWFNLKYEIVYFYNVYGPRQISKGDMATVVGIFEEHFKNKKPFPVVRPGSQTRKFTHVKDTVNACIFAWNKNQCRHYSVASNKSYSIIELAKMFGGKIKYLPERCGERFLSSEKAMNFKNRIIKIKAKIKIQDYIYFFLKKSTKFTLQR